MISKRIRILYIAEFSTGGSVESLLCLVGGLDKSKYDATVLFFAMPPERMVERFRTAGASVVSIYPHSTGANAVADVRNRNMQTRVRKLFGRRGERLYESFKYALHFIRLRIPIYRAIKKKIFELKPDLIHLNNGVRSDTPGILAARRCRVDAVCHVRTFSKLTQINVFAASAIRKFVCISNAVRNTVVDYGIAEDQCTVVANAVDTAQFKPSVKSSSEVREELGFSTSQAVFTLPGRLVAWKGHRYFVEAVAEARKSNDSIVGLIVGDAEENTEGRQFLESLHSLVNSLGLQRSIVFAGHRIDIPDIMKASDVVVCASAEPEPFGRVIIESMAVGTPVIATDAGGARDIIQDDTNGLLVPIKDSHAMARAMVRLSSDSELLAELVRAAANDVKELYAVDTHVEKICQIYESIAVR